MENILLIIQVILTLLITILILLQKSSSIGLGAYSGSNESLFGAKGPGNFLTKATFFLGFIFVCNTIFLGYTYNKKEKASLIDSIKSDVPNSIKDIPKAPVKKP